MSKVLLEIDLPESFAGTSLEKKLREVFSRQALEQAVIRLYRQREISTETGANLLEMSLYEFISFLGENEVSVFDFTNDEWQKELEKANGGKS
jgi:predicted HTH domain antitoxin